MTKIEIKKELKSKLDKICDNEYFVDGKGDYDINQALEALISVYDKNIALNIKNLLYVLENYKKEDAASKFEII